jgi:hypothetical protein
VEPLDLRHFFLLAGLHVGDEYVRGGAFQGIATMMKSVSSLGFGQDGCRPFAHECFSCARRVKYQLKPVHGASGT